MRFWTAQHVGTGLVATLLLSPMAMQAASATFDKTLSTSGTVQLNVSTGSGSIQITPGSDNQVHVIGHVHSDHGWIGMGSAEDAVKQVAANPPIEQNGSIIRIGKVKGDWMHHVSIDYVITTPKSTQLKADSGSGDVRASGLTDGAKLESGSGTVEAENIGGDSYLQTGSGDLRGSFNSEGNVTAGTGSGSIRLENVRGALKAETGSGDITVSGQPTTGWKLQTGSGSIDLALGSGKFSLDAETGSGTVHSDQPITMQGSLSKHHVSGNVNGGGPTVKAITGSGDIRVH